MIVIRKFVTEAKALSKDVSSLNDILAKIESNPGVKVLAKYSNAIIIGIEKDEAAIKANPTLQKAYDDLENSVKADLEKIGNMTVHGILDYEVNAFKKIGFFFQRLFTKK